MKIELNRHRPVVLDEFVLDTEGLSPGYFRFIPIELVAEFLPPQAIAAVEHMRKHCTGDFAHTYVDYHVTHLPIKYAGHWHGWHLDMVNGPNDHNKSRHLILTSTFGTEFVAHPVTVTERQFGEYGILTLPLSTRVETIEPNKVVNYTDDSIHRVPAATLDRQTSGIRAVIRVSETNKEFTMVKTNG